MNKRVAEKLANLASVVISSKNLSEDFFAANAVLPRSCDLRSLDEVSEWFDSKIDAAFASASNSKGQRMSLRTSKLNIPSLTFRKESADVTSDSSDSSEESERQLRIVDEADACTTPKASKVTSSKVVLSKVALSKETRSKEDRIADEDGPDACTKSKTSKQRSKERNAADLLSSEDCNDVPMRPVTNKRKTRSRKSLTDGDDDCVFSMQPSTSKRTLCQSVRQTSTSSADESPAVVQHRKSRFTASVYQSPTKPATYSTKRKLITNEDTHVDDPELQSPTMPDMDAESLTECSTSKRSLNSSMVEQTVTMMQMMLDNTRQCRKDYEEMKKAQRAQAKQFTLMQVAVGRISEQMRLFTASSSTNVSAGATSSSSNTDDLNLNY